MKTIDRTYMTLTVGMLALALAAPLARAQSCAPGLGMSPSDLIFGIYGKWASPAQDYTQFAYNGSPYSFVSPTAVLAVSGTRILVIDNGALWDFTYTPNNGGLNLHTPIAPLAGGWVAMAWDGAQPWVVTSGGMLQVRGHNTTLPDSGVGKMIYDGRYLWISHPGGASPGTLTKVQINPTATTYQNPVVSVTRVPIIGPGYYLNDLVFDGQSLFAVTSRSSGPGNYLFKIDPSTGSSSSVVSYGLTAPKSIAFDGYSIWVADQYYVVRFNALNLAITGSYTASDARALAFDGSQMWVVNRATSALTPIRACDGASTLKPLTMPASPDSMAFDGANLWIASQASHTVSVR